MDKKKQLKLNVCLRKKEKACLLNEIPVADASQQVSLYLVLSMLMIVEDNPFTMSSLLRAFDKI